MIAALYPLVLLRSLVRSLTQHNNNDTPAVFGGSTFALTPEFALGLISPPWPCGLYPLPILRRHFTYEVTRIIGWRFLLLAWPLVGWQLAIIANFKKAD